MQPPFSAAMPASGKRQCCRLRENKSLSFAASPRTCGLPAAAALAASALSCGAAPPVPPLPAPALDEFSPAVRERMQPVLDKARAEPGNASPAGDWGRALYAYGLREAAAQAFSRARAIEPEAFEWAYFLGVAQADLGRFAEAEESLRAAAALRPGDLPASLHLADLLEKAGDGQQALRMLEAALQREPDVAAVHYRLGRLYASRDRAKSSAYLERALGIEPDYREAHYLLANAYTLAGRAADARRHLELFEQADPRPRRHYADPLLDALDELRAQDARTLYEEGLAQQNAGELQQALALYNAVLEIDPDHAQAHISLIAVHGMLGDDRQAVLHFERATALNPDIAEAHYNLGLLRHYARDFKAAAAAFSKALEINPTDAKAHGNLGVSLEQLGRGAEAEEHFRSALQHDPADSTANFHLGRRLAERGRYREALPYLQRALESEGGQPALAAYVLALTHRRLGNAAQAREYGALALAQARAGGQDALAAQIAAELGL